jgi:hypothetical protein
LYLQARNGNHIRGALPAFARGQGAEPNATFRVGADGETGDFKGLTLSNSSPVLVGSRGFSLNRGRGGLGALLVAFVLAVLGEVLLIAAASW